MKKRKGKQRRARAAAVSESRTETACKWLHDGADAFILLRIKSLRLRC